jgi:hypothetical protein
MSRRTPLLLPARLAAPPAVKSAQKDGQRDMDIPEGYIDKFFFEFEALKVLLHMHSYVKNACRRTCRALEAVVTQKCMSCYPYFARVAQISRLKHTLESCEIHDKQFNGTIHSRHEEQTFRKIYHINTCIVPG